MAKVQWLEASFEEAWRLDDQTFHCIVPFSSSTPSSLPQPSAYRHWLFEVFELAPGLARRLDCPPAPGKHALLMGNVARWPQLTCGEGGLALAPEVAEAMKGVTWEERRDAMIVYPFTVTEVTPDILAAVANSLETANTEHTSWEEQAVAKALQPVRQGRETHACTLVKPQWLNSETLDAPVRVSNLVLQVSHRPKQFEFGIDPRKVLEHGVVRLDGFMVLSSQAMAKIAGFLTAERFRRLTFTVRS